MKIKLIAFLLLISPFLFTGTEVGAKRQMENNPPKIQIEGKRLDNKAIILAKYLAQFNSPLQYYAQDFIDASQAFRLDWKMLPAIAGVESTFGKQIPGGFNAWGWGVYGTQAIYFNSWTEGIFTIAKGLRENYLDKGLIDPYSINRVYAASPYWGGKVDYFMQDLEKFTTNEESKQKAQVVTPPSIAVISGQLALR